MCTTDSEFLMTSTIRKATKTIVGEYVRPNLPRLLITSPYTLGAMTAQ